MSRKLLFTGWRVWRAPPALADRFAILTTDQRLKGWDDPVTVYRAM